MPKQSKVIKNQETIHFSDGEREKLQALLDHALANNRGYAPKQHIFKELMELWEFNLTSSQEREKLSGHLEPMPEEKKMTKSKVMIDKGSAVSERGGGR